MKKVFNLLAAAACVLSLQATTVTVTPNGSVCSVTLDGTTYDNVPVTVQNGINLAVVNRDGVSLLVRYTDANTVAAYGTINGENVNYASEAVAAYAKTFQIPNSDFEEWHSVGNNLYEPGAEGSIYSWHSFGTCFGDYSGSARTLSKLYSDNHNNGKCAVIEAKKFLFVVANGTITTGRLKAGSMTAANTNNHSEIDMTKSYSSDDYAKYGPFYVQLNAKPDAIKSSLKVALKNSSHKATISAAITDGTYYQEPQDKTYTNVAATANNTALPTKDWTDYTFPFTYNEGVDAKAIMVTISTNASPGTGSDGDKVYIDDVELVYNAAISNIALNGVTLEGFAFDAATTDYNVTYSGDAMTITADNFDVTAEGMSAIVVKNVEDLGYGNYRVVIGVTSPDFKNQALYTININRNPITGQAYILGNVNGNLFAPNVGEEMTAGENNVYTARVTTAGEYDGYSYFSFSTVKAESGEDEAWEAMKPFRLGAESADYLIDDSKLGTALTLTDWGIYNSFKIAAGTWDITLDLSNKTVTVTKVFTPLTGKVYILGDVNEQGWHANAGIEMSTEDQSTYTAEVTTTGENNYFRFTTELAENDDNGGWAYILPYNIGATSANQQIAASDYGTALPLGNWGQENNFVLPAGKWNFSLDMEARTLTVTQTDEGNPYDVDNDGSVTVSDINTVVNIILGKASLENNPKADCDHDNNVTVSDINQIVNAILGKL